MIKEKQEKTENRKQEHALVKKPEERRSEILIRILSTDIPGNKNVFIGLTKIKGVSFAISNAVCNKLRIEENRKISSLTRDEIESITKTIKNLNIPEFLLNRRKDYDSGESKHLITTDLDLRKEFDIKRLKKIKCYKGVRHSRNLPVRGQRTKSHFRKKGKNKGIGVKIKK